MTLSKKLKDFGLAVALTISSVSLSNATPINGTGDLANGVIFGSGNANGSFTGIVIDGVELALRAKLRFDLNGSPQNTFNYDGDRTYTFDAANSNAPNNRAIWNFEFSVDASNSVGGTLASSGFDYLLGVDSDPSIGITNIGSPIGFPISIYTDNAVDDVTDPAIAQNSQNIGFAGYGISEPQLSGVYTISLSAVDQQGVVNMTSIDVVVEAAQVSAPVTFSMICLGILAIAYRQKLRG